MPDLEGKRQGNTLDRMDQSLKAVFGRNCGIVSGEREDDQNGREIQIRLPLNGPMAERQDI